MEIWKNKYSGKSFFLIETKPNGKAVFLIDKPDAVTLNINLFEYVRDIDEEEALEKGYITKEMIEHLLKYYNRDAENLEENLELFVDENSDQVVNNLINKLVKLREKKFGGKS